MRNVPELASQTSKSLESVVDISEIKSKMSCREKITLRISPLKKVPLALEV